MLVCNIFQSLKSHNSVTAQLNVSKMAHEWLNDSASLGVKQLKIGNTMYECFTFICGTM